MKKLLTSSMILLLCFLTTSICFSQDTGDISATSADRSNCGKNGNTAKVDFKPGQDGESTQILVVCDTDLSGPANDACVRKLASDNLTGPDFKCGPCEIKDACIMTLQELYKGNDTNQYDGANPNPNPSESFTILGIKFCLHDVACKTYPGESKWKAKFDCSDCEWPKEIDQVGLRNINFPDEQIASIQEGYTVYPNPTQGQFDITVANIEYENSMSFIIFDQTGKIVLEKKFQRTSGSLINDKIELDEVSSGLYFYTLVVDGFVLPAKKLSVID